MAETMPVNQTMRTFGYPESVIAEYEHWAVLLRPQQATLGALVMVCREDATAFAAIGPAAFAEMDRVVHAVEASLARAFSYEKINYLMLMMVDPNVHFHVLPRYSGPREFAGVTFTDPGWPRLPDLGNAPATSEPVRAALIHHLKSCWEARS
ncbi:MAG: HIT family protein [Alphaproteobacteria bacterium]|nr:MAG: HIT family protein [Alphaproteobacteria bacterium]